MVIYVLNKKHRHRLIIHGSFMVIYVLNKKVRVIV